LSGGVATNGSGNRVRAVARVKPPSAGGELGTNDPNDPKPFAAAPTT